MKYSTVTKEDFAYFKKCCEEFQRDLGLMRYRIYYKMTGKKGIFAETDCEPEHCTASISLAKEWKEKEPKSKSSLRSTAFHEMCHVLMANLSELSEETNEDKSYYEEEVIVNTLENYFNESKK